MSDRAKALVVLLFIAGIFAPMLWERIFPVQIRTWAEYELAMDDFDKLVSAFEEGLMTRADEKRMRELADAIGRYDERQLRRKPQE